MCDNLYLPDDVVYIIRKLFTRPELDDFSVNILVNYLKDNIKKEDSYYLYQSLNTMNTFSLVFNSEVYLEYILSDSDFGVFKITKKGIYSGRDLENLVLVFKFNIL